MNISYIFLVVALVVAAVVLPFVMYKSQNSQYATHLVLGVAIVVCVFIALSLFEAYNKI